MSGSRIFWISGWSIPATWLENLASAAMPEFRHDVIDPSPDAVALACGSGAGILGGFSLGAHLLLGVDDPRPRILLAPFADLKAGAGLGGAVATTQIRQQLRWFKRDPAAAIADFRARIGADPPYAAEPCDPALLAWGLEQMLAPGRVPSTWPAGTLAVAGDGDPLLAVEILARTLPSLHIVAAAGHHPEPLLAAAARLRQSASE